MRTHWVSETLLGLLLLAGTVQAQEGFFTSWEDRVRSTLSQQPSWPTALFTSNPGLVQLVRFDAVRQITPTGISVWNYDGGKGLDLIPWYRTEFDITLPAYIDHNATGVVNGWGDVSMLLKYRLLSDAEKHMYIVSFGVNGTIPTGSYTNGSLAGTITPTLYGGKGFKRFDVQSNVGMSLPGGFTNKLGRPVAWNSVGQYKVGKYFWPQVENNVTYFRGGTRDGKVQDFVTPGIMLSKFKLRHEATDRLSLTFGVGEQIAATQFHAYNHALCFSTRLAF